MVFAALAECFQAIEQESSRTQKTIILADCFKQLTADEIERAACLVLGELLPPYKTKQFNIADKLLLKAIARLSNRPLDQVHEIFAQCGDLGLVVERCYQAHQQMRNLSVLDVYRALYAIADIVGSGAQETRELMLIQLFEGLDALSCKYVARIVRGDLRLGFSDMTLLDALSWMITGDKSLRDDLEDAYNVEADIGRVAAILKNDGIDGIRAMVIVPGIPIRPSAAERLSDAQAIVDKLGPCIAQPKLDGFRVQVHLNKHNQAGKSEIHFFSRNLQDMSAMFPDLVDEIAQLPVRDCVLEGEAIAYDVQTGNFLPFQETVKRKRKHDVDKVAHDFPLRLYIFDLLYCNGQSLLSLSHVERRKRLLALLEGTHYTYVLPIEEHAITTAPQLEQLFLSSITAGLEGLVVKRPDASYRPGKRNFNWIKLKRQETGSLDDTIDCVILGYYFGQGKRAQFGIGALLVGVYNHERDCFQTIAKIGTGLSDSEWQEQKRMCDEHKRVTQPVNVVCSKMLHPDVWVEPLIVCLIRADEITLSPQHSAGASDVRPGYALRFPRIMGLRPDKGPYDATTVDEIASLYSKQYQRNNRKMADK